MSVATVRAKLKTELEAVTGIGVVHDYIRYANNWTAYIDKFKTSSDKINAWWIEWDSAETNRTNVTNVLERIHSFKIFGIYGLKDSAGTQKVFDTLVESILTALSPSDETFDNTVQLAEPAQLNDNTIRAHSEVTVHMCEIEISMRELIDE